MKTADILIRLHDFISKPILFVVLGVLILFFLVSAWVLMFHWNRYAIDKSTIFAAKSLFLVGGSLLLLIALISLILY